MAVGLEVQSEKVEGDRLGDVVTFCLGSPGLLNIINSRFSSNNRVTPSIDLPPWRMQAYACVIIYAFHRHPPPTVRTVRLVKG